MDYAPDASLVTFESPSFMGDRKLSTSTLPTPGLADPMATDASPASVVSQQWRGWEAEPNPCAFVERLEDLVAAKRSPQEAHPQVDALLAEALSEKPLMRQKLAMITKSAWLRKKILSIQPDGCRIAGSTSLGSTHEWRREAASMKDSFSDHSWPRGTGKQLPGGHLSDHARLLRSPSDKLRQNPVQSASASFSFSKNSRFPGTDKSGLMSREGLAKIRSQSTPGAGEYLRSLHRPVAFPIDGGESVVFGPNHPCPWKSALGHGLNPVHVDINAHNSSPTFSFPKSRRLGTEPSVGCAPGGGGPQKTDFGVLSPGPVYEHTSSFRPVVGASHNRALGRSRSAATGFRVVYCPPEPEAAV